MQFANIKTNTHPFFLHCPVEDFETHPEWYLVKNYFNRNKCVKLKKEVDNIDVITWNNFKEQSIFEKSCDYFGINCHVLGKNIKNWKNKIKIDLTYNFLKKCKKKYVIGIDAFDAVMVRKLDSTVIDCLGDKKIIFNHTPATFPLELSSVNSLNWKFRHLNAGAWMGEVNFLITFYENLIELKKNNLFNKQILKIIKKYKNSEQVYIKLLANKYMNDIWTDIDCQIFQVLHSKEFEDRGNFFIFKSYL